MNRARARIAVLAIPLVGLGMGLGCLGQAERTYFDDLVDGSTDAPAVFPPEGSTPGDSSVRDGMVMVMTGDDADDVMVAPADALDDRENLDAGADVVDAPSAVAEAGPDAAPVEAGCGPTNTVTSCGQCGAACDTTNSTPMSCTAGACKYTCNAGWGDCSQAAPDLNGCETPLNTTSNCGQCGAACDTTNSTPVSCTGGACKYTCNAGWGDCSQAAPDLNGCETPLNTTSNCTGCGVACDTVNSNGASCSGASCTYTSCAAGFRDCHTTPPNADGCECNAPACCDGGVCEPQHDNGEGATYYDCTPIGTYTSALALKACIAYTGSAAQCVSFPCADPTNGPIICSSGATTKNCMCWSFSGKNVGLVDNAGGPPGTGAKNCFCPDITAGDTPWN
jgi:hypothetical protein